MPVKRVDAGELTDPAALRKRRFSTIQAGNLSHSADSNAVAALFC
jgi:hypothetical protein